jgi:hypothetical protein
MLCPKSSPSHLCRWAEGGCTNQIGSLPKKKKVALVRHPQLINMKQNRYNVLRKGYKSRQKIVILKSSQVLDMFPQRVPNSTSILSHMPWQMLSSFHLYCWAKGEELYTSKYSLLVRGASEVSFFSSDGPIKLAHCKKKKTKNLGGISFS